MKIKLTASDVKLAHIASGFNGSSIASWNLCWLNEIYMKTASTGEGSVAPQCSAALKARLIFSRCRLQLIYRKAKRFDRSSRYFRGQRALPYSGLFLCIFAVSIDSGLLY